MARTLILVNHVQDPYLDPDDPDDVALKEKILNFVEEARPYVDDVVWSYGIKESLNGKPFNMEKEKPKTFQDDDLTVINNDGRGLDSGFLGKISKKNPDHVILVGVYFAECSAETALTIKRNIKTRVSVPMDTTNPSVAWSADHYQRKKEELQAAGIDVASSSDDLLKTLKEAYRLRLNEAQANPELDEDGLAPGIP